MRTEQRAPEQSTHNGRWAAVFVTYRGVPDDEYIAFQCTSAFVFDTEDAAYAGGNRALDTLEKTGSYPNMCELF